MAELTDEQDKALKKSGVRDEGGTRRDFSVIHSKQMKKNHLFLGPARFVNVSRGSADYCSVTFLDQFIL